MFWPQMFAKYVVMHLWSVLNLPRSHKESLSVVLHTSVAVASF